MPPDVTDALQRIQHLTCIIPTVGLSVGDGTTLNLAGFVIGIVAEVSKVGGPIKNEAEAQDTTSELE